MDSDFYLEFENNFRGSREQIMQVQSNYDGLLDYILNIDNNPSLLDIGSGRGEWIQKCDQMGFNSIGIELDSEMVNHSRKLDLNIKQGDALSILDQFSENSFSIVSAFHVIEHMTYSNIKELIAKSRRVLKSDGLLILETPSIDNLLVATKSFHIDPTHINPIHPDLLAFIIKRSGFTKLKYYFINGGPLQNSDHDKLTRVFNGVAQDLVLIASKSNILDDSIFDDSNLLTRDMRLGITTLDAAIDFDNYSSNRHAHYDEAIYLMRKRILELERQVQKLITLYENSYLSNMRSKLLIIKRKIIYFKSRLKNKFISLCRYIYNSNLYKFSIKKLYKIKSIFFIIRFIERILDKYGVRIYQYKFSKKSKHLKEDLQMVLKNDKKLERYFDESKDAQNILNDLNKYS